MKAQLSLSTNWNSRACQDGRPLIEAAHRLGLDTLELGYALTHRQADDIRAAIAAHEIRVLSVHAFCPTPMGATEGHPETFSITALEPRPRERAIQAVLDTAHFAAEVGAQVVVLHAGRISEIVHEAKAYASLIASPPAPPSFFARLLHRPPAPAQKFEALLAHRAARAPRYLDALRTSLDTLLPAFEELHLRLGLENLPSYDALPNEPEMTQLLQEFDSPALAYWHDLGHGQIRANLGFIHHASVLRRLTPHLAGLHIHDVIPPLTDHVMPPLGHIDFSKFAFLADLPIPAVLEPAPNTPESDLQQAIAFLHQTWDAHETT